MPPRMETEMPNGWRKLAQFLFAYALGSSLFACSTDDMSTRNSGGSAGSRGTGGASGIGGGSGGASVNGGAGSAVDAGRSDTSTGGAGGGNGSSAGGAAGIDGARDSAIADIGVADAADAAPIRRSVHYTFDLDTQGWIIGAYDPSGIRPMEMLVFNPADADGNASSGSLELRAPLNLPNPASVPDNQADAQAFSIPMGAAAMNWAGFQASAKIELVSSGTPDPGCPLRAYLYVTDSSGFSFAAGAPIDLRSGAGFLSMTLDLAAVPVDVDPTQINQFGIQVIEPASCVGDGAAPADDASGDAAGARVVLLIDDVFVDAKASGDASSE